MNCKKEDLLLYAVTDRHWLGEHTLYDAVEEALQGGVTFLQLREKNTDHRDLIPEAAAIRDLCHRYQVPFVVDDDVDLALEINADGVHVGQDDMEVRDVRAKLGPNKIIGVTAKTVEQALWAQTHGADYIGSGAVFATSSKPDAKPLNHETLQQICKAVSIPVVAIGGVDASNIRQLAGRGVAGVAVIQGIFGQPNIKKAAEQLHELAQNICSNNDF